MPDPGVASFGIKISYKLPAGSPTGIPRVTSVKKPGRTVDTIDATHHESTGKEFLVPALEDYGEVTVGFNWIPDDESWIDAIVAEEAEYTIDLPDGAKIEFDGFATGYEPADSTIDGKEEATLTIKVTGEPEFTPAPVGEVE